TATDRSGAEAGEIAHDAAAERDHRVAALDARRDQRVANPLEHRDALRALAGRHADMGRRDAGRRERRLRPAEKKLLDGRARGERRLGAGLERRQATPERGEPAAADHDVIGTGPERDPDSRWLARAQCGRHAPAFPIATRRRNAATISSTIVSCGT